MQEPEKLLDDAQQAYLTKITEATIIVIDDLLAEYKGSFIVDDDLTEEEALAKVGENMSLLAAVVVSLFELFPHSMRMAVGAEWVSLVIKMCDIDRCGCIRCQIDQLNKPKH